MVGGNNIIELTEELRRIQSKLTLLKQSLIPRTPTYSATQKLWLAIDEYLARINNTNGDESGNKV